MILVRLLSHFVVKLPLKAKTPQSTLSVDSERHAVTPIFEV